VTISSDLTRTYWHVRAAARDGAPHHTRLEAARAAEESPMLAPTPTTDDTPAARIAGLLTAITHTTALRQALEAANAIDAIARAAGARSSVSIHGSPDLVAAALETGLATRQDFTSADKPYTAATLGAITLICGRLP
jgi:hypothetical protein